MTKESYKYILRYAIQPGHQEEPRLDELIAFCQKARIDDVMFFIDCEELSQGHLTIEETRPWMEIIARGQERLEPLGITTSINPWPSLLHADRGRTLKTGQKFTRMVDPYGNQAGAVACPLSKEWRGYFTQLYAHYASTKPNMLWVEDDFRFHNHAPLIWGGCFCEAHMKEYSRRAGNKLTRDEFVKAVLKPGRPHPYRKIWLDTAKETMVELADIIGQAVHRISPTTRLGLMSSRPDVHCAEGRDWSSVLKGLATGTPMVNRPHLPAYSDTTPQSYLWDFSAVSRMSRAMVPGSTEIYPEIENFPFTRFSKSKKFMGFQLETSLVLQSSGITLNIFNMMGSGAMMKEGYQDVLAESKDFLSNVKGLGLDPEKQVGVKILIEPQSSYTLHTREGSRMEELYPKEDFWAGLLSSYGIANTYSLDPIQDGEIVAVSGQYFRNLNRQQLTRLFERNKVLLEAEAAFTLFDMGYGGLAEIRDAVWHAEDSGFQAYEQVCDGKAYYGIDQARLSAQMFTGDLLEVTYNQEPDLKTVVKNPYHEVAANGMTLMDNRVLILPFGRFEGRYQSHLNPFRQEIIHGVLRGFESVRGLVFTVGEPYISIHLFQSDQKWRMIIFNASVDPVDTVKIYAPDLSIDSAVELSRSHPDMKKANIIREGDYILLHGGLDGMELKVLSE